MILINFIERDLFQQCISFLILQKYTNDIAAKALLLKGLQKWAEKGKLGR